MKLNTIICTSHSTPDIDPIVAAMNNRYQGFTVNTYKKDTQLPGYQQQRDNNSRPCDNNYRQRDNNYRREKPKATICKACGCNN